MNYDVIIVGAGPGGSAAAYYHAQQKRKVLLLDKTTFPRDKICGDGVTGKSLSVLHDMGLTDWIEQTRKVSCNGVLLTSPNKTALTIPINSPDDPMSAFCIERENLDEAIFMAARQEVKSNGGQVEYETVIEPIVSEGVVIGVKTKENEYHADLVIGAGGYNCPISRYVLNATEQPKQNRQHYSSAVREYWEGLEGNSGEFEIHFIDGILPGYFWIFPISETKYNIGIGMLLDDMDNQKVKLKQMLDWVTTESFLAPRFANANKISNTRKGWLLPLGSPRKNALLPRKNFMPGCLLIGDAASLVDPFTGEGIGNALVSGKLSAQYPIIDEESGVVYQTELWNHIGSELTNSHRLQKMINKKWLMNWFFKKANKKPALQEVLTDMLHNKESQGKLSKWFLVKQLLF
jgi:geranylgeranyl reductase family protein